MTLKQLQYFVTVVKEGSMTAAARRLFMSQPPLSAQMKLLEEEFGCVLFDRGARQIKLTPAGHLLYEHALTILELNRITREEMLSLSKKERETIRIGIVSSLVCSQAFPWIQDFSAGHPGLRFEITEGNTYELLKKLSSDALHMAIVRSPFSEEGLTCKTLAADAIAAIGRPEYFQEDISSVSLRRLAQKPLIVYRRWEPFLSGLFLEHGLTPDYFCINDDARTTLHFAQKGMGIGLAPQSVFPLKKEEPAKSNMPAFGGSVMVLPIEECNFLSEIKLVSRPGAFLPYGSKAFLEFLYSKAEGS